METGWNHGNLSSLIHEFVSGIFLCADAFDEKGGNIHMKITLKDGSVKEYGEEKSVYEIAKDISDGLARAACAGELNGKIVDLRTKVTEDADLNIITANDPEGI